MTAKRSHLTELRRATEWTQAALAQQLGLTQRQVSKYEERGGIPPRLVKPWARLLGVTPDALLPGFSDSPYADWDERWPVVRHYVEQVKHKIITYKERGLEQVRTVLRQKPTVVGARIVVIASRAALVELCQVIIF